MERCRGKRLKNGNCGEEIVQKADITLAGGKKAEGFVIGLGQVNLVFARTDKVMIACGAFDVMALDRFDFAAVKIKALTGSIKGIDDLLSGEVVLANNAAVSIGVKQGQKGKEVLEAL